MARFLRDVLRHIARSIRVAAVPPMRRLGDSLRRLLGASKERPQVQIVVAVPRPFARHRESVDIIVCVHNALQDVRRCLESVVRTTFPPYRLILVDDGSDAETAAYLDAFAASQGATLLRNGSPRGYTCAANQGLRAATADFMVLLNSNTIATHEWLDRLVACAESDPAIALVGPLSNTASWQSVPQVFGSDGDWARNELPEGMGPEDVAAAVRQWSARLYPRLPFLNGFCLLLRRRLLERVGYLDETTFPFGYGEENDLCLRAAAAGFSLAVADDAYVYHAQSRSYSDERRRVLAAATDAALVRKHGAAVIEGGVHRCRHDPVLAGARARIGFHLGRLRAIHPEAARREGARVLFPVAAGSPSWAAESAWGMASALIDLGVDARVGLGPGVGRAAQGCPADVPVVEMPTAGHGGMDGFDAMVDGNTLAAFLPAVDLALFRPRPRNRRGPLRLALSLARTGDEESRAALLALMGRAVTRRPDLFAAVVFDDLPDEPLLRLAEPSSPCQHTGPLSPGERAALLAAVDILLEEGRGPEAAQLAAEARACGAVVVGAAARLGSGSTAAAADFPNWLEQAELATLERLGDDAALLKALQLAGIAASPAHAVQEAAAHLLATVLPAVGENRR